MNATQNIYRGRIVKVVPGNFGRSGIWHTLTERVRLQINLLKWVCKNQETRNKQQKYQWQINSADMQRENKLSATNSHNCHKNLLQFLRGFHSCRLIKIQSPGKVNEKLDSFRPVAGGSFEFERMQFHWLVESQVQNQLQETTHRLSKPFQQFR